MIKNSIGRIDPLKVMVCAIGIVLVTLIVATCGLFMKVSDLSHENELLVAQKETLHEVMIDMPQCETGRFKYDPITGSIYDNETKSIYQKVEQTIRVKLPPSGVINTPNAYISLIINGGNDER